MIDIFPVRFAAHYRESILFFEESSKEIRKTGLFHTHFRFFRKNRATTRPVLIGGIRERLESEYAHYRKNKDYAEYTEKTCGLLYLFPFFFSNHPFYCRFQKFSVYNKPSALEGRSPRRGCFFIFVFRLLQRFGKVSVQPIFTTAFSSIPITRGYYAGRSVGGMSEGTQNSKDAVGLDVLDQVAAQGISAVPTVPNTDTDNKSTRQNKPAFPEKSTDAEKTRSKSGDILDLSNRGSSTQKSTTTSESQKPGTDSASAAKSVSGEELTPEEQQQVAELKARDSEVRAHEAAHLAAAGPYATGGPSFEYQTGPDGKKYAIGGSVQIDSGPISGDPEATIEKARIIRSAALAPASPSSQDQKVAAAASQMEAEARMQKAAREGDQQNEGINGEEGFFHDEPLSENAETGQSNPSLNPEGKKASEPGLVEKLLDSVKKSSDFGSNSLEDSVKKSSNEFGAASAIMERSHLSNGNPVSAAYQQMQHMGSPRTSFVAFA